MRGYAMRYGKATGGLSSLNDSYKEDGRRDRSIRKINKPHLTDEQAKEVIRTHLNGVGYSKLADRTGFSESTIRALCEGVNRGHLLRDVEMEPKQMMGVQK